MKPISLVITSIFALAVLSGCGKIYTADYLMTDNVKRKEILADCKANKQSTENCDNANQAQSAINLQIQTKSMKLEALKMKQSTADNYARMFGTNQKYQDETKARQQQIEQLKSEMEALTKQ